MILNDFELWKVKWLKGFMDLPTPYYPLKCPGVTTILDLIPDPDWEKFIEEVGEEKAKQIQEAAWNRGKSLHTFIEHFIKEIANSGDPSKALQYTQKVSIPILENDNVPTDKIDKGREMFYNFYHSEYSNAYKNLIGTELPLYSPILFYRGKADVFYNENGVGKVITDFKGTSKRIEKGTVKELKYKRQLGGYALAAEHLFKDKNVKIEKASILAVHTKSDFIQEIICSGDELIEQKKEFETLTKEWHRINNQSFLFNE